MKELLKKIYRTIKYLYNYISCFRKFGRVGLRTTINKPLRVVGGRRIYIGNSCFILDGLRIEAISKWLDKNYEPRIDIDDRVTVGQNCHFTCANRLHIGKGVSILPQVLITDIEHEYIPDKSLRETGLEVGSVEIGENAVIGMGARILGHKDIKIGKSAIIGTNAVVTHDVPDYSMVAGIPAKVIKKYDFELKKWIKVEE